MLFSNPYFVIFVLIGLVSLMMTYSFDGQTMPRTFNYTQTMLAVVLQWVIVAAAILWEK